jgi:hypothetical protein
MAFEASNSASHFGAQLQSGRGGMVKAPKKEEMEGDPKRGDEILKRMLQTKPKPQKRW